MSYILFLLVYANIKIVLPFRIEATLLTYTPYRNYLFFMNQNEADERQILLRHGKSQEKANDLFNENPTN